MIVDINEIKTHVSNPFVAAVELSRLAANIHPKTRWYQNYSVPSGFVNETNFENGAAVKKYEIGDEVSAMEAVNDPVRHEDTRPKFFDSITQTWSLLDTGACVSCIPKGPKDKMDSCFKLRAVNGQSIPTFGSEVIQIRINRKQYEIEAIKTDIPQRILGWDLFRKYNLGFEWNEFGDLFLTDKKSDIKTLLKFVKTDRQQRVVAATYEEPQMQDLSPQAVYFQTACMQEVSVSQEVGIDAMTIHPDQSSPMSIDDVPLDIDSDSNCHEENLKALEKVDPMFGDLIKKYPDILKANFKKEPASDIYHRIETTGEPFKSKMRPLLADSEKSKEGKKLWEAMEKLGVIERVKSNTTLKYTSPVHMVKKPNGRGWRVCADFRLLNQRTVSDNYPLPMLRSFQGNIKGSKLFSTLDLKSAFHHLPIHPQDVEKTCVLSPWGGAFVYKRLAFGLTNGPSSWQKYIDRVLSGIDNIFCYLDDILVWSEDVEGHLSTLEQVFKRLQQHGLTLALDKCTFARETIDYLGYQVSGAGIRPLQKKTEAINRIPEPQTQKQLLHFLGALNYFRSSLSGLKKGGKYQNAANLLQPLYSVATVPIQARKFEEVWSSNPQLKESFQDAKLLLKQAAQLAHPDPALPLALMTDASQHSIGSVLMQRSLTGKWVPLGYMSKHLPIEKTNWSTCRKELLAAQAGLRYFISEIYGRHCTIFSDHAPLVLAFKNPQGFQLHDPVAQRALMEIGQFTKDIRHIAGLKNTGSDFLSRIPPESKGSAYDESASVEWQDFQQVAALEGHRLQCMTPKVIFEAQKDCKELELIKAGKHAASVIFKPVMFQDVELWCEASMSKPRPFLPKRLRQFAMKQLHYAHDGIKESVRLVSSHYYWTDMKKEITTFVQTCHGCQSQKATNKPPPHYGTFEVPDQRFTHCHVDIVGPLPESEGYKYILSVIDRTTRHLSAFPLKEPSAKSCSQAFLLHYVSLYGIPSACTSDQGSNFVSSLFQEMQNSLGIEIHHTPIYWPQGNGLIERSHRTLKDKIKAQLEEMGQNFQDKWIQALPWALLGQRTAFNKDLGTSSSELTFGTQIQVPGTLLQDIGEENSSITDILQKLHVKNNRLAVPTSTNPQKEIDPPQKVSHVYARQHETRGLQTRYRGPFKVISRPSRTTLEIKVGVNKDGSDRTELRAWADCKQAYLRDDAVEAERPKRGRPKKDPENIQSPDEPLTVEKALLPEVKQQPYNLRPRASRVVSKIDLVPTPAEQTKVTGPPPFYGFRQQNAWSATPEQLDFINKSIVGS